MLTANQPAAYNYNKHSLNWGLDPQNKFDCDV